MDTRTTIPTELLKFIYNDLKFYALKKTFGHVENAEDLLHDTIISIVRCWPRISGKLFDHQKGWCVQALNWEFSARWRKLKRDPLFIDVEFIERNLSEPINDLDKSGVLQQVQKMHGLGSEIIKLNIIGYSMQDIAKINSMPINNLYTVRHKTIKKLQRQFNPTYNQIVAYAKKVYKKNDFSLKPIKF